jgi:fucose 4-O-acetylase-like acetyltransferase
VEKIGESANQLKKLKNFEQNIKNLLIPYLIFYLNYPQLEVLLNLFRSKNSLPRKSQKSRII